MKWCVVGMAASATAPNHHKTNPNGVHSTTQCWGHHFLGGWDHHFLEGCNMHQPLGPCLSTQKGLTIRCLCILHKFGGPKKRQYHRPSHLDRPCLRKRRGGGGC